MDCCLKSYYSSAILFTGLLIYSIYRPVTEGNSVFYNNGIFHEKKKKKKEDISMPDTFSPEVGLKPIIYIK
jgi:hypothetical protein